VGEKIKMDKNLHAKGMPPMRTTEQVAKGSAESNEKCKSTVINPSC